MSSRSNGVTNVASSLCPIAWLISSPRCSASRISPARRSISSQERSIASSSRAAAEDVGGVLDEQVEEPLLARDQSQSHGHRVDGRHSPGRPRAAAGMRCSDRGRRRHPVHRAAGDPARDRDRRARSPAAARSTTSARPTDERRATGDDLGGRVRRLIEEADAATFELDGARRDLAYLIELIGIGIVRLDDDRRIELANAAAHAFLDRPPGSLRGLTLTGAFLDARIEAIVEQRPRDGIATGEVRLAARRRGRSSFAPGARRSAALWLVLEDVSELRRLQQIRAEFIDNLSHELRTPLTTVSLLAETLTREAEAAGDAIPAKMRDRIGKIEVETGHLVQMVNELLDLSRIETGVGPILLDDVDLGRIATAVDRATAPVRRSAGRRPSRSTWPAGCPDRSAATRRGSARCSSTCSTTPSSSARTAATSR